MRTNQESEQCDGADMERQCHVVRIPQHKIIKACSD